MNGDEPVVRSAVADLWVRPPLNRGELKARLQGLPKDAVRSELLERLAAGDVPLSLAPVFAAALKHVKLGRHRPRLGQLVRDESLPWSVRQAAHAALVEVDQREAKRAMDALSEADRARLADSALDGLLETLLEQEEPGQWLAEVLARLEGPELAGLLTAIESRRKRLEASATELYGPALVAGRLAGHQSALIACVAADGTEEAAEFLESLAASATGESAREARREALRLRTALIDASRSKARLPRLTGKAWVTSCDGQGAFNVFFEFARAPGGPAAVVACARLREDLRDGNLLRGHDVELATDMRRQFKRMLLLAELPLGVAARFLFDAEDRTLELGRSVPKDLLRGLKLVKRIEAGELPPVVAPEAGGVDKDRVLEELEAIHLESWFFDEGDFLSAGLETPSFDALKDLDADFALWISAAAAAMDGTPIRSKLLEMARHESRMRSWLGHEAEATLFSSCAHEIEEKGLRGSVLVEAMLERSLELRRDDVIDSIEAEEDWSDLELSYLVGDEDLRRSLRVECFPRVERPKGYDLARLDLAEAIAAALEAASARLPGELRPRSEQMILATGGLATHLVRQWRGLSSARETPSMPEGLVEEVALSLDLEPQHARTVALRVYGHALGFLATVCAHCPVACWEDLNADRRSEYFADAHPSRI